MLLALLMLLAAVACRPLVGESPTTSLPPTSAAAPSMASSSSPSVASFPPTSVASRPAVSLPPTSAAPQVVLEAYLQAVSANDCSTGRQLVTRTFVKGNGELCGDTQVTSYEINPEPARPSPDEAEFATQLTTTGTADRSIEAGTMTWFYDLKRQPDGSWRITGGGSGP